MALDKILADQILDTWRNFAQDLKNRNAAGEHYDKFIAGLAELESMAEQYDDIAAFSMEAMKKNIYTDLSEYYSKALSSSAAKESVGAVYDDTTMLKTAVDALKNSISLFKDQERQALEQIKKDIENERKLSSLFVDRAIDSIAAGKVEKEVVDGAKGKAQGEINNKYSVKNMDSEIAARMHAYKRTSVDPETIIACIQPLIDLAEQPGMTYPRFLKIQIEKGLDKAASGIVATREGLVRSLEDAKRNLFSPVSIEEREKKLEAYDKLAAASKFNVPEAKELSFVLDDIAREFEPKHIIYDNKKDILKELLDHLSLWSLSFVPFAPNIDPWNMIFDPKKRQDAIIFDQKTQSGFFKAREQLLLKYFKMSFIDLLRDEVFIWCVKTNEMPYSQEFVEFLAREIYPNCIPCSTLSGDIVKKRAGFHSAGPNKTDREHNPELYKFYERGKENYEWLYGKGSYDAAYPNAGLVKPDFTAAPWDLGSFNPQPTDL